MPYIGKTPTKVPLTSDDIADGTISNADLAGSITSAKITSLDATKLTGTVADARFPATLPASSGANLTALPAANLTGTVADARISTLTASKLSGALPAISGASLTGIVAGPTVSASDPAIDTNATLGTQWANSTSGEFYVCTDATTDNNVWTNVDAAGDSIAPYSFGGSNNGYTHCGAHAPYMDHVDKFAFASGTQDAVDHGDDTSGRAYVGGNRSATHGYVTGGLTTTVSKIQYASDATYDASPASGTLSWSDRFTCNPGCSSPTHGYVGGWESHTTSIEKITFATDAVDARANGLVAASAYGAGATSEDYGYVAGGSSGVDTIQRYALAAETVSTDVGNLQTGAGYYRSGASSSDYGYSMGGDSPESNVIERYSFASGTENADNVGDLAVAKGWGMSQSSKTYGYFSGGDYSPQTDDIEKWAFASSTTDAEASGSLTVARMGGVGTEH